MNQKKSGWYLVWEYISKRPFIYIVCVLSIAVSSLLSTIIPKIIGDFTDAFNTGKLTKELATYFGLLILGVGIARVILGWIGRLISAQHGRALTYDIRDRLFKKWETLPMSYYHEHSTGDLLSHALNDVQVTQQLVTNGINQIVNSSLVITGVLFQMFLHINLTLAVVGLGPLITIPFIVRYYRPKIKVQSSRVQAALGVMSQSVEESMGGVRTIKAFGNEDVIIGRFAERIENIVGERMKQVSLSAVFSAVIPFTASIGFVLVIAYGGYLAINKVITLGDFVSFLLFLILLRQPLEQIGNIINIFQRGSASLSRIADLLDASVTIYDQESLKVQKPIDGNIQVKNLSFKYPTSTKNVLSNISFEVKKGQTLGIIGTIGSGKTTLVNLLLRVYDPPRGTVFIDGVEIHDYSLDELRKSIAFVPQNGFLFSTNLDANIAFASDVVDDDRVVKSAKIAVVHKDVLKLKERYKTEVGERGVRLSGGQKQRVSIARAIYKDSPVNVLDDSLSAVDTKNERLILSHLRDKEKNKTNIIVSHRLSAVMHADEIIILDEGRIVDRGTHFELLEKSELYNRLWSLQAGEEQSELTDENPGKNELLGVLLAEEQEENEEKSEEGGEYGA